MKKSLKQGGSARLTAPSSAQLQLIEAAVAIREQPDDAERAFMARQLVLCTLPHSDPGDIETWTRRAGNSALGIQPAFDFNRAQDWLPLRHHSPPDFILDHN